MAIRTNFQDDQGKTDKIRGRYTTSVVVRRCTVMDLRRRFEVGLTGEYDTCTHDGDAVDGAEVVVGPSVGTAGVGDGISVGDPVTRASWVVGAEEISDAVIGAAVGTFVL